MKKTERSMKARLVAAIVLHLAVIVVTIFSVQSFFTTGGEGNMTVTGAVAFRYFTVDSNILAAVSSFIMMICAARRLGGKENHPAFRVFSLSATVSVSITFLTVMCFLGPFVYGYPLMFIGVSLYMHLTTPLMEIISFIVLESPGEKPIKRRYMITGIIPMLLYGGVYMTMVVFLKKWPDFYAFNTGGLFWLTMIIMTVFAVGISYGLGLTANAVSRSYGF